MRHLSIALIVIALLFLSAMGDLGYFSAADGQGWDFAATLGIVYAAFALRKQR